MGSHEVTEDTAPEAMTPEEMIQRWRELQAAFWHIGFESYRSGMPGSVACTFTLRPWQPAGAGNTFEGHGVDGPAAFADAYRKLQKSGETRP